MKKNLAKATALLLTAGMLGGTGITAAASDVELNPGGTYPVVKDGTLEFDCFTMSCRTLRTSRPMISPNIWKRRPVSK